MDQTQYIIDANQALREIEDRRLEAIEEFKRTMSGILKDRVEWERRRRGLSPRAAISEIRRANQNTLTSVEFALSNVVYEIAVEIGE